MNQRFTRLDTTTCLATLAILLVSIAAYAQTISNKPAVAPPPAAALPVKQVFAHYMVCCTASGGAPTLDDYKKEIQEAQKRGVDGFALNVGGWQKVQSIYKTRTSQMYEAARQLGTGFKLMVSMDYCCGNGVDDTRDAVRSFKDHPNQFRYDGKPVISTFAGEGSTNANGQKLVQAVHEEGGIFVPYFYPHPEVTEIPAQKHVDQVFNTFPDLDGFFYFGAAGNGKQLAQANARLAQKWTGAGKIFMAGISPYYRANGGNYRVFETRGFQGMAEQWESAIANNATWAEIVTWNDWNESSYVGPFGAPAETNMWKGNFGPKMLSHVAYLDASRYYIDWFKNGSPPPITQDELYYFYRLHPRDLKATVNASDDKKGVGQPYGAANLVDMVFVTAYLKDAATLTITSGNQTQKMELKAGVQQVEMPFGVGPQRFVLERGGKIIFDKTGEHEISATDTSSRFNYFAGSASN